jgi:hypothetical protein
MEMFHTATVVMAFVGFMVMSVVAHVKFVPAPVPVRATPEAELATLNNCLYL